MASNNCLSSCIIATIIILSPFIAVGLMIVLLVLFAGTSDPTFSIREFHVPALNMSHADYSRNNISIYFDLKLKNENKAIGLHYPDQLNITFSYFPNVSTIVFLGEYRLDSFYQGNGKARNVRDMVVTNGRPVVLDGTETVAFRVDLVAKFRFKKAGTKRHKVDLGCVVEVDYATGKKMRNGVINLVTPGCDAKLKRKPPPDAG